MDFWSIMIKTHYFIINWQLTLEGQKRLAWRVVRWRLAQPSLLQIHIKII